MKKKSFLVVVILMISLIYKYMTCTIVRSESSLVSNKIKPKEVISIQFISAAGNSEYPVDSKVITSQEEIKAFIQAINSAKIENVSDGELADCESSTLIINLKNKGTINFVLMVIILRLFILVMIGIK